MPLTKRTNPQGLSPVAVRICAVCVTGPSEFSLMHFLQLEKCLWEKRQKDRELEAIKREAMGFAPALDSSSSMAHGTFSEDLHAKLQQVALQRDEVWHTCPWCFRSLLSVHFTMTWRMDLHLGVGNGHQQLKHATACRSTCFWGLLVRVLKHAAAH